MLNFRSFRHLAKALARGDVVFKDVVNLEKYATVESLEEQKANVSLLTSAVGGDINFKVTPATVNALDDEQNVGEAQVMQAVIEGKVGAEGAGDINVTLTADGSSKTVAVALANEDDAATIATKIKAELDEDFFTITRSSATLTFTANDEAANDETMDFEVATDDATFDTALDTTTTIETEGSAPYTRDVLVQLVDTDENIHTWFTGTVPVTTTETTAGDGTASVATLSPTMTEGVMTVPVTLQGTWAAADTNTLSVTEKSILGYTVAAKTSVETTVAE